jgi:hypothetical protein
MEYHLFHGETVPQIMQTLQKLGFEVIHSNHDNGFGMIWASTSQSTIDPDGGVRSLLKPCIRDATSAMRRVEMMNLRKQLLVERSLGFPQHS